MFRRSNASDLLNRASSQLRGERPVQSSKDNEKDELAEYLSSLNKKTGSSLKTPTPARDEISDISVSSEDRKKKKGQAASGGSKWLKKKKAEPIVDSENDKNFANRTTNKNAAQSPSKFTSAKSSALDKAEAFQQKFKQQKKEPVSKPQLSDSDLSMNISIDSDIVNEIEGLNSNVSKFVKSTPKTTNKKQTPAVVKKPSESVGKPQHSQSSFMKYSNQKISDEDSTSIGKGSNKFMKKKPAKFEDVKVENELKKPAATSIESPTAPRKQLRFDLSLSSDVGEKTPREPSITSTPRKPALKQTRFASSSMTDEDHFDGISSSSSFERSPLQRQDAHEYENQQYLIVPEADISVSSDGSYKVNVMDIESLEPAVPIEITKKQNVKDNKPERSTPNYLESFGLQSVDDLLGQKLSDDDDIVLKTPSPKQKKNLKSKKSKEAPKVESDFFSSFGLQTLDDLEPVPALRVQSSQESIPEESESEIKSEPESEGYKYESDFESEKRSAVSKASSIPEVPSFGARSAASVPYSEDFEETSASEIKTESDTDTESTIKTAPSRGSRDSESETDVTMSESSMVSRSTDTDTSSSTSTTITQSSVSQRRGVVKKTVKVTSVEVQTAVESDFRYAWDSRNVGLGVLGPRLQYTDPTPIACHVISPDTMNTLTAYSPSVLALNDMLKQQLALTQQFVSTQRRMYDSLVSTIEPGFKYTTLEDTKKYIRKHRKPKLTYDEALKMVQNEMKEGR